MEPIPPESELGKRIFNVYGESITEIVKIVALTNDADINDLWNLRPIEYYETLITTYIDNKPALDDDQQAELEQAITNIILLHQIIHREKVFRNKLQLEYNVLVDIDLQPKEYHFGYSIKIYRA